jgi:O-phosphoseryl-tRNA(Cys) synthetase
MDNFDTHKWFKKEYLGESHTKDLNEEAGLTEMDYYDKIKFHLNQYNAGNIDGDDLANAIEKIVLDAKVDAI